jgi:hypothetical protein
MRGNKSLKISYFNQDVIIESKIKAVINMNSKKKGKKKINTLMIFDDTNSRKQKYSMPITDLFSKGRHFGISTIYTSQTPTLCDNIWKENSDIITIFNIRTRAYKEHTVNNLIGNPLGIFFQSVAKEKDYYIKLIDKTTSVPYQCLVYNTVDDKLYKYKAPNMVLKYK